MKFFILLFLIYICSVSGNMIKNGIYNFIIGEFYLFNNGTNLNLSDNFKYPFTFIRIKKAYKIENITYYNIENLHKKSKLGYFGDNNLNFYQNKSNSNLWNFIQINGNKYIIKNKNNCFIKVSKLKIYCEKILLNEASQFKLIRIFSERKENKNVNYINLLNREPIDVLIKYIDLRDPNLKRDNIHQIEKDFDNQELRYCIRSVLKNIPWIRKIFILMPNKKVSYFKKYNLIKDKIIYLYDKDLLGYDSSNSNSFQFIYWKLKIFGISDNIITMDDDYFIGKKLEKNDFFYVKNGKVVPLIINANFIKIDQDSVKRNIKFYDKMAKMQNEEQNGYYFKFSQFLTLELILKIFNISKKDIIYVPYFRHNAIPLNLIELKEAYKVIYKSKFRYNTLDCGYRTSGYIQFQFFILSYTFLKYYKKVNHIPTKYINLKNTIFEINKYPLFCINKGAQNYTKLNLYEEKIMLEYLFPKPSPYEITDYKLVNLSFNTMKEVLMAYQFEILDLIAQNKIFYLFLIILIIAILLIIKVSNNYYYNYK